MDVQADADSRDKDNSDTRDTDTRDKDTDTRDEAGAGAGAGFQRVSFRVCASTQPGEQVVLKYRLGSVALQVTPGPVSGSGPGPVSWTSEPVELPVGQLVHYSYFIQAGSGQPPLESTLHSLKVLSWGGTETIDDGVFVAKERPRLNPQPSGRLCPALAASPTTTLAPAPGTSGGVGTGTGEGGQSGSAQMQTQSQIQMQNRLTRLGARLDGLEGSQDELRVENTHLRAELENLRAEVEALHKDTPAVAPAQQNSDVTRQFGRLEVFCRRELQSLRNDLNDMCEALPQDAVSGLATQLSKAEQLLASTQRGLASLSREVQDLHDQAVHTSSLLGSLTGTESGTGTEARLFRLESSTDRVWRELCGLREELLERGDERMCPQAQASQSESASGGKPTCALALATTHASAPASAATPPAASHHSHQRNLDIKGATTCQEDPEMRCAATLALPGVEEDAHQAQDDGDLGMAQVMQQQPLQEDSAAGPVMEGMAGPAEPELAGADGVAAAPAAAGQEEPASAASLPMDAAEQQSTPSDGARAAEWELLDTTGGMEDVAA